MVALAKESELKQFQSGSCTDQQFSIWVRKGRNPEDPFSEIKFPNDEIGEKQMRQLLRQELGSLPLPESGEKRRIEIIAGKNTNHRIREAIQTATDIRPEIIRFGAAPQIDNQASGLDRLSDAKLQNELEGISHSDAANRVAIKQLAEIRALVERGVKPIVEITIAGLDAEILKELGQLVRDPLLRAVGVRPELRFNGSEADRIQVIRKLGPSTKQEQLLLQADDIKRREEQYKNNWQLLKPNTWFRSGSIFPWVKKELPKLVDIHPTNPNRNRLNPYNVDRGMEEIRQSLKNGNIKTIQVKSALGFLSKVAEINHIAKNNPRELRLALDPRILSQLGIKLEAGEVLYAEDPRITKIVDRLVANGKIPGAKPTKSKENPLDQLIEKRRHARVSELPTTGIDESTFSDELQVRRWWQRVQDSFKNYKN